MKRTSAFALKAFFSAWVVLCSPIASSETTTEGEIQRLMSARWSAGHAPGITDPPALINFYSAFIEGLDRLSPFQSGQSACLENAHSLIVLLQYTCATTDYWPLGLPMCERGSEVPELKQNDFFFKINGVDADNYSRYQESPGHYDPHYSRLVTEDIRFFVEYVLVYDFPPNDSLYESILDLTLNTEFKVSTAQYGHSFGPGELGELIGPGVHLLYTDAHFYNGAVVTWYGDFELVSCE